MENFAILLRGVNVGGINIKMADLRECLATLPVQKVKTLLASGNVVLASELPAVELKNRIEEALRKRFDYQAWVVVLTVKRIAELIEACPYSPDSAEQHSYVTLSSEPAAVARLLEEGRELEGQLAALGPEAVAWLAPVGGTLESPISKLTAKAVYKSTTTTRNLRTLIKIRDAAAS
ncbi:uncharacterized protein (DUF1697 family) [Psychromicrobium silvestre]|uniref:Uncharacterized protein (DUF1697 family) n=1 Tax=Psychromicrobium silvestre TaxID=1645614 RepID=A0A7Y9LS80_9MICC|nr:DUF1697 domain-containing protein [Psychromicrobium silvestre]NYE94646.1 uncharacterized protein (DUF1697 family) [Psychromicrobium silvestre]